MVHRIWGPSIRGNDALRHLGPDPIPLRASQINREMTDVVGISHLPEPRRRCTSGVVVMSECHFADYRSSIRAICGIEFACASIEAPACDST
jgi:hypothetical protein